jgi:hypothetical protein
MKNDLFDNIRLSKELLSKTIDKEKVYHSKSREKEMGPIFCFLFLLVFNYSSLLIVSPVCIQETIFTIKNHSTNSRMIYYRLLSVPITLNIFDDDESDEADRIECLGLDDFLIYNLMLLRILPPLSSMATKVCITICHIIAKQIGLDATDRLECLCNQETRLALPLPVVAVTMYAFLLHLFSE